MKNLFKHTEKMEPEKPIDTIQEEIDKLNKKEFELHGKIMSETYIPKQRQLSLERAKILHQINVLMAKQEHSNEVQASEKTNTLFRSPKYPYIIEMNGSRITPDKDLMITLKFTPCKHEKKMHVKEILRYQHTIGVPFTEEQLFNRWQATLVPNSILTTSFNCEECRKAIEKKFNQYRRYSDADKIGACHITLRTI